MAKGKTARAWRRDARAATVANGDGAGSRNKPGGAVLKDGAGGEGSRGTRRGVPPGEQLARLPVSKQKCELRGGLDRWRWRIGVKPPAFGRLALARLVEVDANDFAKGRAVFPAVAMKAGVHARARVHPDAS